jgi:hypothetical protein
MKSPYRLVFVASVLVVGCRVEARPASSDDARPAPPDGGSAPATPTPAPAGSTNPSQDGPNCGGIIGLLCPAGTYCAYVPAQRCGAGDQMSKCKPRPEVCTEEYNPVCGCDRKDYGNACDAARHGTAVAKMGKCDTK